MKTDNCDSVYSISRRNFINRAAAVSAGIAFVPASNFFGGNSSADGLWP